MQKEKRKSIKEKKESGKNASRIARKQEFTQLQ